MKTKQEQEKEVLAQTMSVKQFADATGRFSNQIYDLINKGNSFGKLKTTKVNGKIRVYKSEIEDFAFTIVERIEKVEERLEALEQNETIPNNSTQHYEGSNH